MSQATRTSQKEAKIDSLDQNRLEPKWLEQHCSIQKLRITYLKLAPPVEQSWLGSSEVHSNVQSFLIINRVQSRCKVHLLDCSSKMARVEWS